MILKISLRAKAGVPKTLVKRKLRLLLDFERFAIRSETYEPAIYMCKETSENGVLLNEYRCVHAPQGNYGKPSDSNKIMRSKFNVSFHF